MIVLLKNNIRRIRYGTTAISVVLMVLATLSLAFKGLNFGLDFTGGAVTEVKIEQYQSNNQVLAAFAPYLGEEIVVTPAGETGRWLIRHALADDQLGERETQHSVASIVADLYPGSQVISSSVVGAQVGQDLVEQGGLALLITMLSILAYLSFRFEWRLASGALIALGHDVLLVLGLFAFTQMEFNLTVFAAILAIIGYSLNDSIVIADRIRDLLVAKQDWDTPKVNDTAILATFSRTIVTSGTTLFTIGALWILGGVPLTGFATAMFFGILSGTWSSISVGTVLPEWLKVESKHYLKPVVDATP